MRGVQGVFRAGAAQGARSLLWSSFPDLDLLWGVDRVARAAMLCASRETLRGAPLPVAQSRVFA